jgi:hypothetical protein
MKHIKTYEAFLNEGKELELGVKYVYTKTDEVGYISTGGSDNPKHWEFLVSIQGRGKNSGKLGVESYPYEDVKKYLKPAKDQKGGGFEDYLNKGGRVWDNENQEPGSEVSEKKQELGLYVIGRTSRDNTKIGEWLKNSDFHAEWNAREGYWLFPADDESEYDELERELDMQFANHGIDARFEGIFESSVNESMETIVDDPTAPGVFARIKKNKQEYRDIIKNELNKKFDMEDSGMLFPHQYKEGVDYYTFSMDDGMGETTARIIFPNSEKDKEKEKFAKKVADHISKFVEKDSKIKKIENGPSYSGEVAGAFADPQNGNWTITWRPKFFVRKQN